ncbi:MAG: hypothetical protein Kow0013_01510 [Pararhodobacter sp.]
MARSTTPAPAALTPIALILLLWHAGFAADYVVTRFGLGEGLPGIMHLLPLSALWLKVAWAMAVWLGFGAAFFLVLRDNASVILFFAAAVAALVVTVGLYPQAMPALPVPLLALCVPMVVLPAFGWVYARALNRNGVLH